MVPVARHSPSDEQEFDPNGRAPQDARALPASTANGAALVEFAERLRGAVGDDFADDLTAAREAVATDDDPWTHD